MKRLAILLAVVVVSASAPASFEFLAVVDRVGKINRYDPVTMTNLGSFGTGYMSNPFSPSFSPDGLTFTIHDTIQSRYLNFDPYSGTPISTPTQNGFGFSGWLKNGLYAQGYVFGGIAAYASNQSTFVGYYYGGGNITAVHGARNGLVYAVDTTAGKVVAWSGTPSSQTFFSGGTTSWGNLQTVDLHTQIAVQGSRGVVIPGSGNAIGHLSIASNGAPSISSTEVVAELNNITGVVYGHGDYYYVLGTNGTGQTALLRRIGTTTLTTTILSGVSNPGNLAAIIAPEPTSMAVFAVGGLALLLRKRR